ncbi:hypothetical protein H6G90_24740 [Nostoc sp. FACHB-145]|nr:hypothetical protein [Nostoc sp. FACHB-145]
MSEVTSKSLCFLFGFALTKVFTLQNFHHAQLTLRLKLTLASLHVAIILAWWRKIANDGLIC